MTKLIDEKTIQRMERELNWASEMYTMQQNAGFDKQAADFWNKLHGMINILQIMGLDWEYTEDMKMRIIEKEG